MADTAEQRRYLRAIERAQAKVDQSVEALNVAVGSAYVDGGCSWAQIAEVLGIKRQTAHERFRQVIPDVDA